MRAHYKVLLLAALALLVSATSETARSAPIGPVTLAVSQDEGILERIAQRRAFRGGFRGGGFRGGFAGRGRFGVYGRGIARPGFAGGGIRRRGIAGGYGPRPGWHGGGVRRNTVVIRRNVVVGGIYRPYGAWWRPGAAVAAGAAIGFVGAATAAAWAGGPPAPGYCWYYTNTSRTQGFWDRCPT